MAALQPGIRLRSAACTTEVIVTRGGQGLITCGGHPMVATAGDTPGGAEIPGGPSAARTLLGKRYRAVTGTLEVLCIRQGVGTLQLDGMPLQLVTPKPLPASD